MSEAVRIARETTLVPVEVQRYLHGGLDGKMIKAIHNLACAENITMGQVVERLFSYDPVTGYQVRPEVGQVVRELGTRTGTRPTDPKTTEGDKR